MIDRLTPRKAFALGAAAFILVTLVGWFLFLSPKLSEAADLEEKIGVAETNLVVAEALKRDAARGDTEAELARLTKAVPEELGMSTILRELSAAATAARIRVTGITPQAATPQTGYQAMPMTITVEGSYFAIAKFLHLLRTRAELVDDGSRIRGDGRLYSVDSIQFGTTGDGGFLTATTTVNAFYFGSAQVEPGATATTTDTTSAAVAAPTE